MPENQVIRYKAVLPICKTSERKISSTQSASEKTDDSEKNPIVT